MITKTEAFLTRLMRLALGITVMAISTHGWAQDGHHAHHGAQAGIEPDRELFSDVIPASASLVKRPPIIDLQDGGHLTMTVEVVKQQIGNKVIKRLAYNGSIPGPLLRAKQGTSVKVTLVNKTDVATTLHSHGLRLDYRFDGVVGVGQKPIRPGESFTYTLTFPDAGVYWYHPHLQESYAQEMGLYGNYVVTPKEKDYYNPADSEHYLIVDDMLMVDGGIAAFAKGDTSHALMGRYGNVLLVNDQPDYKLEVKQGDVARLFFTNAANTRTFRLSIPGVRMKRVAGDAGLFERDEFVDEVIVSPSERVGVELLFNKSGRYKLQHRSSTKNYDIAEVIVAPGKASKTRQQSFDKLTTRPKITAEMVKVRALLKAKPDKEMWLDVLMPAGHEGHAMHAGGKIEPIEWEDGMEAMNKVMWSSNTSWRVIDVATGKANMDVNWRFRQGDLVKIRVRNDGKTSHPMQHPIHFHGQRFAVLAVDGKENTNLVWKDTVLVNAGSFVDIILDASNVGIWMAHCHIAEHLSAGMMIGFEVTP